MKALRPLRSTAAVIDVLGGNQQFQQDFDANPTTVSNWRNIGRFPHWMFPPLSEALRPLGFCVPVGLFGLSKEVIAKTYGTRKKNGGANGRAGKRKRAGSQKVA